MTDSAVYRVMYGSKGEDRPNINFSLPQNRGIPWHTLSPILDGSSSVGNWNPIHLVVRKRGALQWHTYGISEFGMFSKQAVDLLGPYMKECFEFLEATVNEKPYFVLRTVGHIDCFDRDNSDIVYFDDPPPAIRQIRRYAFCKDRIPDPCMFRIPEFPELLATESIKEMVEASGMKGFYFIDAAEPFTVFL